MTIQYFCPSPKTELIYIYKYLLLTRYIIICTIKKKRIIILYILYFRTRLSDFICDKNDFGIWFENNQRCHLYYTRGRMFDKRLKEQ